MASTLAFTKMHGAGNDFVILDQRDGTPPPDARTVVAMAKRHTGVGFDQLLVIRSARSPDSVFAYDILNADGSPAGQCGNGLRCVAAWLHRDGALALGRDYQLDGPNGPVTVQVLAADWVRAGMGEPSFEPADSGFDAGDGSGTIEVDGEQLALGVVSMGNPHAVIEMGSDDDLTRLRPLAEKLSCHRRFADGCNVGLVRLLDASRLRLVVHERGAGWTQACGSGACAAVALLHRRGKLADKVQVELPGGSLDIEWQGPGHGLWMSGPARFVFEGVWLA